MFRLHQPAVGDVQPHENLVPAQRFVLRDETESQHLLGRRRCIRDEMQGHQDLIAIHLVAHSGLDKRGDIQINSKQQEFLKTGGVHRWHKR